MRQQTERGFTLVEIMIVVAIIALLAAIAIPNVLRGRTSANEAAAIGNIRSLVSSLEMYRSVNNSYPDAWQADMYTTPDPDFGPPSFNIAMAGQTVQGYNYTFTPVGAEPNVTTYTLVASPQVINTTGSRGFFVDQNGTVRHCRCPAGAACNAADATDTPINTAPNAC